TRARREVCMVDKANAMAFAGGLWQSRWKAIAPRHPEVGSRHLYSDACAMELVRDPSQFDVIVTGNLFGDLLSDLSAQLIGGMGVAPSANLNPETGRGLFEPVHGSAPKLAGRGIVNPVGAILSSAMMLAHLGFEAEAAAVEAAVVNAIRAGECTADLGGGLSTSAAGDAIARRGWGSSRTISSPPRTRPAPPSARPLANGPARWASPTTSRSATGASATRCCRSGAWCCRASWWSAPTRIPAPTALSTTSQRAS